MSIVYLNGNYLPQDKATVSVLDRGFLFSDSVYEVVPAYQHTLINCDEHLCRLKKSLAAIHIPMPLNYVDWRKIFITLLEKNPYPQENRALYLQVTRGAENTRSHTIPSCCSPTVFVMCTPSPRKPLASILQGFRAVTVADKRRQDCYIKSTSLLPNILAHKDALDLNADEAILIRDGHAFEGTSSNLFIVKNQVLMTPPLQPQILAGITRQTILSLAKQYQVKREQQPISVEALKNADEIWLTGSLKEIYPIIKVDGNKVGNGKPGPMWHQFFDWYQQYKLACTKKTK